MTFYRHLIFTILFVILTLIIVLVAGELTAQLLGLAPWKVESINYKIEPEGSFFQKHDRLGYITRPGKFTITVPEDLTFHVTNFENGIRITQPPATIDSQENSIWIFGCSFTYGWILNNEETFLWLVQKKFPEIKILNLGIPGYGTLQNLLHFEQALEKMPPPNAVFLTYAGFHDQRNISTRSWRQTLAMNNKLGTMNHPRARLDKNGKLQIDYTDLWYYEIPFLNNTALVQTLEKHFYDWERQHYKSEEVTEAIINRFHDLCRLHQIDFFVMTIDEFPESLISFCDKKQIRHFDISVDLSQAGFTHAPYDKHPSELANKVYADKFTNFLNSYLGN